MSKIIKRALKILEARMSYESDIFRCPNDTKIYFRLKLGDQQREIFSVLYLTNKHQLISYEELFMGTIDGTTIHVREVVKMGLALNAAAIICAHNHPQVIVNHLERMKALQDESRMHAILWIFAC